MSKTKRHHYIPQFYINKFVDENGYAHVYDKERDNVFSAKPSDILLETGRNNFPLVDDALEHQWASFDYSFSSLYNKNTEEFELTDHLLLVVFIESLRWRVPAADHSFNSQRININLERMKFKLDGKIETEVQKARDMLESSAFFQEAYRMFLPWDYVGHNISALSAGGSKFYKSNIPILLTDNPVLTNHHLEFDSPFYDCVFPFTSSKIYCISKKNILPENIVGFSGVDINILLMFKSKRFFAAPSREYINVCVEVFKSIPVDLFPKFEERIFSVFN